jgi:deoxycytidylate deaminase
MLSSSRVTKLGGGKKLVITVNYIVNNNTLPSVHAEHDGLKKLIRLNKHKRFLSSCDKIDMLVVRISKTGTIGYSRPCHDCLIRITNCNLKINKVYYSNNEGTIVAEPFGAMLDSPLTKFSSGKKQWKRSG